MTIMNMENYKVNYSNELIKEYSDLNRRFKMLEDIHINAEVTLYNNINKKNILIKMKTSRNTLTTFCATYKAEINNTLKTYLMGMKLEAFSQLPDDIIPEEDCEYKEFYDTIFVEFTLEEYSKGHVNLCNSELLGSMYEELDNITEDYEVEDFSKLLDLLEEDLETKDELLELNKLRDSFKRSVKI